MQELTAQVVVLTLAILGLLTVICTTILFSMIGYQIFLEGLTNRRAGRIARETLNLKARPEKVLGRHHPETVEVPDRAVYSAEETQKWLRSLAEVEPDTMQLRLVHPDRALRADSTSPDLFMPAVTQMHDEIDEKV